MDIPERPVVYGMHPQTIVIKRLLSISFVFAFLANGLGNVLAANWCLRQLCKPAVAQNKHPLTHKADSSGDSHCSSSLKPSSQGHHQKAAGKQQLSSPKESVAQQKLGRPHCGHCVGAPQSPARSSINPSANEARRDEGADTKQVTRQFILPGVAYFPAMSPSQGAPPVPTSRRHLLINIFLI